MHRCTDNTDKLINYTPPLYILKYRAKGGVLLISFAVSSVHLCKSSVQR